MVDGRPSAESRATAAQLYADFSDSVDADVTLRLLRSRNAMAYLAMMSTRLADGQVDADHLIDGLRADLADLAPHWTSRDVAVPSAEDLLDRWVKDGFVARTLDAKRDMERYHLTRGATTALAQVSSVRHDRSVATETTLAMIVGRLSNIAVAINPDPAEHVRHIDAEIADLQARKTQLAQGFVPVADFRGIGDDIALVTSLADRMPADIIGYGEKLRENSRTLLTSGLDDRSGAYADALNRMFDGHDALAESPEGAAFDAFYTLISDHRLRATLENHIDAILRGIPDLPDDQAETLARFIDRMWDEVQRVDDIRGQVYRRINTFVKGGDFLQYRALREQIAAAQRAGAAAFEVSVPGKDMGIEVPMNVVEANSVGALSMHDGVVEMPADVAATVGEIVIDPASLVGAETIDWQQLTTAVNAAVGDGLATLPDILDRLSDPRVGDVVGVWSLAQRHQGVRDDEPHIQVGANTSRGLRLITLPAMSFHEPLPMPVQVHDEASSLFDVLESEGQQ